MANKKKPAADGSTGTVTAPAPAPGRGGPRGPRGIKLALPAGIQKQLDALPRLYPDLKKGLAQERFLALLSPSLDAAFTAAFDQLVNDLEAERTAAINALRGVTQQILPMPDSAEMYAALEDGEPQ